MTRMAEDPVEEKDDEYYKKLRDLAKKEIFTDSTLYPIPNSGEFQIKDSGERTSFPSGAVRDSSNKIDFTAFPYTALTRVAQHYTKGKKKYPPEQRPNEKCKIDNFKRGMDQQRTVESLARHFFAFMEGWRDEDHLSALTFNALQLIETEELVKRGILPKELLNLPDWTRVGGNLKEK